MENKIKYFNNTLFRNLEIELVFTSKNYKKLDILHIYDGDQNIYTAGLGMKVDVISIINDEVVLLVDGEEIKLNNRNDKLVRKSNGATLKVQANYAKKIKNFEQIIKMNEEELLDYFDSHEDHKEREQINHLIVQNNPKLGFSLFCLEYALQKQYEKAIVYAEKTAEYGYYRGYYYLGREYFHDSRIEQSRYWLERIDNEEKLSSLSETQKVIRNEYLGLIYHDLNNEMKAAYYAYQATKRDSSIGWYIIYMIYQNENFCFLPRCKHYMKYCYDQITEIKIKKVVPEPVNVIPIKPDFRYLDQLKKYIKEDINLTDLYIESKEYQNKKSFDMAKAEVILNLCCDCYFPQALFMYGICLNSAERNQEPVFDDDGTLAYFPHNLHKSIELLRKGASIHHFDCLLTLLTFIVDDIHDDILTLEETKGYYDLINKLYSEELKDEFNKQVMDDFIDIYNNSKINQTPTDKTPSNENDEDEESEEQDHSFLNNYELYLKTIALKQKFLQEKQLKTLTKDFKPKKEIQNLTTNELEKYATYYLTCEYNERLAYFYASLGYLKNNSYCTYLMGIIYELGIFIPRVTSYAKFFYEKINAEDVKCFNHLEKREPQILTFNIDEDFFIFDPIDALIDGIKLISTASNEMPDIKNMNDGLKLIKKASEANYAEAKYILGCLYFDVNQGDSRLFNKGKLIQLEANPYLAVEYFDQAIELGHEKSMLIMASMHSYKFNHENKVKGTTDDVWCRYYWHKIYELYQYHFIKDLGLTGDDKMLFDFYGIRFGDLGEFLGNNFSQVLKASMDKTAASVELGNCIVGMFVNQFLAGYLSYKKGTNEVYYHILYIGVVYYIEHELFDIAYELLLMCYKVGIYHKRFDEIAEKINASKFEVEYHKLLSVDTPK